MYFAKTMKSCLKKTEFENQTCFAIVKSIHTQNIKNSCHIQTEAWRLHRSSAIRHRKEEGVSLTRTTDLLSNNMMFHWFIILSRSAFECELNQDKFDKVLCRYAREIRRSIWWYNNTWSVFGVVNVTET